ncbi:MAG: nucleotidyltransferase domain-containing protein [Patescibacteria group bacterium]
MDTKIRKVEAMDQRLQQIEQELKEFKEAIEDISPTDGIWLFGSQVSGKQKEYSDIDVAVVSAVLLHLVGDF